MNDAMLGGPSEVLAEWMGWLEGLAGVICLLMAVWIVEGIISWGREFWKMWKEWKNAKKDS